MQTTGFIPAPLAPESVGTLWLKDSRKGRVAMFSILRGLAGNLEKSQNLSGILLIPILLIKIIIIYIYKYTHTYYIFLLLI